MPKTSPPDESTYCEVMNPRIAYLQLLNVALKEQLRETTQLIESHKARRERESA